MWIERISSLSLLFTYRMSTF